MLLCLPILFMPRVKSSHLRVVKYDSDAEELTIQFRNGDEYEYLDVSENEYEKLMRAKSHGKQFWKDIRQDKITIKK